MIIKDFPFTRFIYFYYVYSLKTLLKRTTAMKIKLTIRQKILIFILGAAVILFSFTIGFFSISNKKISYSNITKLTNSYTDHYAAIIENWLNSDMVIVRTLSRSFLEHKQMDFEKWRDLIMGMYRQVIIDNKHIDAIWDSWEFSYLDPNWNKSYGRWIHILYHEQGKLLSKYEKRSLEGDPPVYATIKSAGRESIVEPYLSSLQKGGLMTSLTSPMYLGGRFIGLVGIDLFLGRFQTLICEIKPYPESNAFLISNSGTYIAHPDTLIFSKNIEDVFPLLNSKHRILERIKKGERFNFTFTNENDEKIYYAFSPIEIGRTQTPWSLGIMVPVNVILAEANRSLNIVIIVGLCGLLILVLIILFLANNITQPIKNITELLTELSKGKVDNSMQLELETGDEISKMGKALTLSIDGLMAKTDFANNIGKGNLDHELNLLSEEDTLGKSLLEMRDNLRKAQEGEKKRKIEEEKRSWINEGLAKFGEILRQNNDNLSKLGDELIKNMVWYLKASLGGIFVANETNSPITYDLVSAFAYDRIRYLERSFEEGEGLIGSCAAEKETIFLAQVPNDYIEVTSGLGGTQPNSVLLIPLKIEQDVLGVIELASLSKFLPHEIEFLEKLAESIASTLRTVKINQKTSELLKISQEQSEIMKSQEEEMRQNMEELQATQEESARKASEMEGLIDAINASSYVTEYDVKGNIININKAYLELHGMKREEIIGRHHSENLVMTDEQKNSYDEFWSKLQKGIIQKQTSQIIIAGKKFTFHETYTPIHNTNGEVYKILKISTDISTASEIG